MGAQTSAECFQCGEKRPRPEKESSVDDAASLAPSDFSAEVMNQYRTESSDTTDRLFVENGFITFFTAALYRNLGLSHTLLSSHLGY